MRSEKPPDSKKTPQNNPFATDSGIVFWICRNYYIPVVTTLIEKHEKTSSLTKTIIPLHQKSETIKTTTMKKVFLMVVVAMMTAMSVNAQSNEPRHEIGLSYGLGASAVFDGLGYGVSNGIFDSLSGVEAKTKDDLGTVAIEYFYHLNNPRIAIGGIVAFAHYSDDVVKKKDNDIKVGERTRDYFTVMPAVKYDWVHKSHFALYSKAAAGVMFHESNEKDLAANKEYKDNDTFFMYQLSFIGMEFGAKVRGFFEAGVGEQGIILGGVKFKF